MSLPEGFKVVNQPKTGLPEGFSVVEQSQPMSKGDAALQGMKNAYQWFKGNDEFQDAGNIQDYINTTPRFGLNKEGFALAASSMFGNDDDLVKRFQEYNPGIKIEQDNTGNRYFEQDGKKYYFNRGGVDLGDALDVAGEAGTYIAGAQATAPIKALGTRMLATGGTEAAINAGNQMLAGRDEIDKKEVALTGAFGAAAEGLAPLVSKAWRWAKDSAKTNKEAGAIVARELGASNLTNGQAERLGKMVRELDPDQVDPQTILQHVELNQTPTRGTLTKDQYLLDAENQMRSSGRRSVQEKFQALDDANQRGLGESIKRMGGVKAVDDFEAADNVLKNLRNSEAQARQGVNQAYDDVGQAFAKSDSIRDLPNTIKKALSDNSVIIDPDNVSKTNVALKDIERSIKKMGDAKGVSWQAVDQQRKRLNGLFSGASPEDKRALTILKEKYDDVVHNAFENDLLSGDKDTIAKVQKARGMAADYFNKYKSGGKNDQAGGVIEKWLQSDVTAEQVADGIINVHGNFNQKSAPMVKRLVEIAGNDSQQVQAVRDLVLQRMTRKLGEPKTREALRASLRKSLKGNPTLFDTLFSKKEINFLSRGLQYLDSTTLTGVKGRTSGTAERLNRWANMSVGDDLSMSGVLNTFKKALGVLTGGEDRAMQLPMRQLTNNPTAGAVVATQHQTSAQ